MARFIDSDKLIWQVQNNDKYGTITKQVFISLLQNSETEDVAPVVHAHWIKAFFPGSVECGLPILLDATCSRCDFKMEELYSYCPNCGAIMDEEVDNA